ncbi:MAG TPA: PEP-CTERM sorting domain-containing protein, partial [Phenylobacterium sp.]
FATPTFFNSHPCANNCQAGDFSGWRHGHFTFTAQSTSQMLSFLAKGNPAANLPPVSFLDGVSLSGTPEPAVWGMMTLGFGAMGAMMRRRRRLTAA